MTSPAQSSDDRYSMRSPFRGLFVIINNEIFSHPCNQRRTGTERDAERLQTTFEPLGFEIMRHDNKTCIEMFQLMIKVKDLSNDYDCVAVAILTHGKDDKIFGVGKENDLYTLDNVLGPLKDIKKGIPKLVIIQACRGVAVDEGHEVQEDHDAESSNAEDKSIRVPMEADFLYHFSTSPGYYSFRNATNGSIFIQELCNVFDECTKANVEIDVVKSMIKVNRRVAENYQSYVPTNKDYHQKKQMPSFVCMLRKELFLKKQA